MQRIEHFLDEEEVPEWASTLTAQSTPVGGDKNIGFAEGTFRWQSVPKETTSSSFELGPLNLVFPEGQLSLISGATGSGKSALLAALLGGETRPVTVQFLT